MSANSVSLNAAIASKFPDPAHALELLGVADDPLRILKSFQRDTITSLADCMVTEAARLERENKSLDWKELKRQAQILRDYAETLLPAGPGQEATR
ncbi:MAG TPA: hypothetical protein VJW20_20445 [Candidatus Angelobacter sp.]|nr:hypothetical protein [Candidatus Angelobacter sp.]